MRVRWARPRATHPGSTATLAKDTTRRSQDEAPGAADRALLAVAALLVAAGIGAFYWFAEHSLLLRVLGLLAVVVVAAALASRTAPGRRVAAFLREAQIETRKVVWPTRAETVQTTGVVLLVVVTTALGLWLLDMLLGWAVRGLTGTGA